VARVLTVRVQRCTRPDGIQVRLPRELCPAWLTEDEVIEVMVTDDGSVHLLPTGAKLSDEIVESRLITGTLRNW